MKWLKARSQHRGQVLIIFALALPAMLGMIGLAMDGAMLYVERRHMQSAADLAALSGAIDLPANSVAAKDAAISYAAQNGYSSGVTAVAPYGGNPGKIEVTITRSVNTTFMQLFGYSSVNVSARAVAIHDINRIAIFAGKNTCDFEAIDWSGSSITVNGDVHSSSGFKMGGSSNNIMGTTTYKDGCTVDFKTSSNTYGVPPAPATKDWPISYVPADFTCTYTQSSGDFDLSNSGAWWANAAKTQLNPGVYCAPNGTVKLSNSDVTGNVTFVGKKLDFSGSNNKLTAYDKGILGYATACTDDAIKVAGSGNQWAGVLYSPCGKVEMSGSVNNSISGGIIAWTIKVSGSSWSITSNVTSAAAAYLVE